MLLENVNSRFMKDLATQNIFACFYIAHSNDCLVILTINIIIAITITIFTIIIIGIVSAIIVITIWVIVIVIIVGFIIILLHFLSLLF